MRRDFVTQALTWVPVEAGAVSTAPGGWGKQWADGPGRAPGAEPTGPDLGQLELRAAMCRWAAAFPCALKCHLRLGCRALQELEVGGNASAAGRESLSVGRYGGLSTAASSAPFAAWQSTAQAPLA